MKLSTSVLTAVAIASVANALVIPSVDNAKRDEMAASLQARDTSAEAEAPVYTASVGAVADKYIVVLKNELSSDDLTVHKNWVQKQQKTHSAKLLANEPQNKFFSNTAKDSSDKHGGISFDFDIEDKLKGYAGYFLKETIEELKKNKDVAFIEQDAVVKAFDATTQDDAPWGLARIASKKSVDGASTGKYLYDADAGEGVTSFIVDTGINTDHEDFEGRASWGTTFPSDGDSDGVGHGTHCAGTIGSKTYGVAKKANLVAVKVLDSSGSGTNSDVIKGIQWVAKKHKENASKSGYKGSTANMSLGGGKSEAVNNAANAAVEAGVHFAVAAGNENQDACNTSPASAEKVVTVGASTNADARASFSNYGKCVDIFAPGQDILSTWIGSSSATNTISGTSMASPHIAGLLTYFLSLQPSANSTYSSASAVTPAQLKKAIISFGTEDALSDVGTGSPNVLAYNGAGGDLSDFWKSI